MDQLIAVVEDPDAPMDARVGAGLLLRSTAFPKLLQHAIPGLGMYLPTVGPVSAERGSGGGLPYYSLLHDRRKAITPQLLSYFSDKRVDDPGLENAAHLLRELWPSGTAKAMLRSWLEVTEARGAKKPAALQALLKRL